MLLYVLHQAGDFILKEGHSQLELADSEPEQDGGWAGGQKEALKGMGCQGTISFG